MGCPAGTASGGQGVYCGIECHFIHTAHEPTTLMRYCTDDYMSCPTWRAEKERVWERRRKALIEE